MEKTRLVWRNRQPTVGDNLGWIVGMVIILGRSIRNRLKRMRK